MWIFFTDGLGIDGCNQNGTLVIAPWTEIGSTIGGIKIDQYGNIDLAGNDKARELKIKLSWWNDKVFSEPYQLMSLTELDAYVKIHQHLPDVPSETELLETGGDVGDLLAIQMGKIEELTLYIIQLQNQINTLTKKIEIAEKTD